MQIHTEICTVWRRERTGDLTPNAAVKNTDLPWLTGWVWAELKMTSCFWLKLLRTVVVFLLFFFSLVLYQNASLAGYTVIIMQKAHHRSAETDLPPQFLHISFSLQSELKMKEQRASVVAVWAQVWISFKNVELRIQLTKERERESIFITFSWQHCNDCITEKGSIYHKSTIIGNIYSRLVCMYILFANGFSRLAVC